MTSRPDAATSSSPSAKRRGILKKQLSFETDEPRPCLPPPPAPEEPRPCPPSSVPEKARPCPPPAATEPQRPRPVSAPTTSELDVTADADSQSLAASVALRTPPSTKNKAVARRLLLRERRSFDDETMTSYPADDQSSGDARWMNAICLFSAFLTFLQRWQRASYSFSCLCSTPGGCVSE